MDRMGEGPAGAPSPSITPVQQLVASSAGALLTALFVTPLDVVKIRLQSQQTLRYRALKADSLVWKRKSCYPKLTPLDVVKIRLQSQQTLRYRALKADSLVWKRKSCYPKWKCFLYCNGLMDHIHVCQNTTACGSWYKTPTHFNGTVDAFVKISRSEGLRSLWSGLPPTLVMAVPTTVIYFTCYDQLKGFLCYGLGYHSNYASIIAGGLARLGAVTVITPLELVRTKMQSRRVSYSELRVCISSAVTQSGVLSLWRGWGPTVLRDVPFSAMYWFNYELLKAELCERYRTPQASFPISFAAGAASGAIAAITTLPFDVVKTRRQIELGEAEMLKAPLKKPSSTWVIMKSIWTDAGYRGLFAGFLPRVIKVAPACAIMISTYEFGKAFFRQHNQEQRVG